MGQARVRSIRAGGAITVDLSAPEMVIGAGDRINLRKDEHGIEDEGRIVPQAVRLTLTNCVQAAFPNGMDRRDGKAWAVWQDVILERESRVTVTRGDVEWLQKHLAREDLKVPMGLASWRESVLLYLDGLLAAPAEDPAEKPVP